MRSATVPSRPATGSESMYAVEFCSSCAIATSSRPTCWGETRLPRDRPEPSAASRPASTELANSSTLLLPRLRVPFPAARRREPLEQHLGEEVVRGHVGLLDQLRHRRRGDRGERLGAKRRGREVRASNLPADPNAPLAQGALQALGGDQLGRAGIVAAVVAVVEREPGERAQVGAGPALAVEDRGVGEDPALDPLDPGGGDVAGELETLVAGWSCARAKRAVPKAVAVADDHQVARDHRVAAPVEPAASVDAGLEVAPRVRARRAARR